jgi:hypothetical protein
MTETTKALRSKQSGNSREPHATSIAPRRLMSRWWILGLLCAGLIGGVPSKAEAQPAGSPTANDIFYNCTFTTADLNVALTITQANKDQFLSNQIEASYIIIYVRQNANDGQELDGSTPTTPLFTGPVLCTNIDTDDITVTTEGTAIAGPVDVLGAEEVSHLQVRSSTSTNPDDTKKRVCHTVASKTQCFLIQLKPVEP